jgi:sortase (surface protein transpeptidase)
MTSRTRALIALLASAAVLVASGIAWATSRGGVGADIERVAVSDVRSSGISRAEPERPDVSAEVDDEEEAEASAPGVIDTSKSTRVDATKIVIPEPIEPPQSLSMESIGVTMPVLGTGVTDDGQMELPDDPTVLGWYRYGSAPGDEQGSAVLAGHVDSIEFGVGPLNRLANVAVGDVMTVAGPDGSPLSYQVTDVQRIPQAVLPTDQIFREDGPHQLVVITCGGRYLPDAGGYEDNIVVTAQPVDA